MPVHKVEGGYQWGSHGKVYPTQEQAEKQGEAAYANGYRGDAASDNELDIAKKIRSGELSSPQKYENIWLFDVRVTGTGTSYRSSLNEYVFRDPIEYLTDEFVERCNGLPLIFGHPGDNILNTQEFRDRSIGTIILPYVSDEDVRGIAKVLDGDAATLMQTTHQSTSPAVMFREEGSAQPVEIDGKKVMIEGKPSYIDHLAICKDGVWDKGGNVPKGVKLGEEAMTDIVKNDDAAPEAVPAWADALVKRMDAMEAKGEEVISEEAAKKQAEKEKEDAKKAGEVADKTKADEAKEKEESQKKADAIKADEEKADAKSKADSAEAENTELKNQVTALTARIDGIFAGQTSEDREALSSAQSRADALAQMLGDSISPPLYGETPIEYRVRLAGKFVKHSKIGEVKLDSLDPTSFAIIEDKIYADAKTVALNPSEATEGRLIPIVRKDSSGREITEYQGDMNVWLNHFKASGQTCSIQRGANA